eukprot:COSAG02_NODE_3197_length_7187_cov_2.437923_4_plen_102_part_00
MWLSCEGSRAYSSHNGAVTTVTITTITIITGTATVVVPAATTFLTTTTFVPAIATDVKVTAAPPKDPTKISKPTAAATITRRKHRVSERTKSLKAFAMAHS